jgi:hypothetical protein
MRLLYEVVDVIKVVQEPWNQPCHKAARTRDLRDDERAFENLLVLTDEDPVSI